MRETETRRPGGKRFLAAALALCLMLSLAPAALAAGEVVTEVTTAQGFTDALANGDVTAIRVTGNVTYSGDINRAVDIVVGDGETLTYEYHTDTSNVSTESLANFTVESGGKLVLRSVRPNTSSYKMSTYLIFRGSLSVEEGGAVETARSNSTSGTILAYGDISNKGTISLPDTASSKVFHAIDMEYVGNDVTGTYKRNLCRSPLTVSSSVTATGAAGGTGVGGVPCVGDVLYGIVDGYGATDANTPKGAFTFDWQLQDALPVTGPSYTVPLSAAGKTITVGLNAIGEDYVFCSVTDRKVKEHSKNNQKVQLGTITVPTHEKLYLGGEGRSDSNDGLTPEKPLATVNTAILLASDGATIMVCGDTTAPTASRTTVPAGKDLTFERTNGVQEKPVLHMNSPVFSSDVTLRGVAWTRTGNYGYCSVDENTTVTLDNVTASNFTYLQGKSGAKLIVRNSTLSGAISGLLVFDSIELDNAKVTALANTSFPADASDVILKNGSTLSVSKDIKSLTSVGEGNTIQARKLSGQTLTPVTVTGPVSIETGKPITLSSYFKGPPIDCLPYLISTHASLTPDKFVLEGEGFAPVKYNNIIYAASTATATLAPLDITQTGATLRGAMATGVPLDGDTLTAAFSWWPVGDEENKQILPATSAGNSLSASLSDLIPDTLYAVQASVLVNGVTGTGDILTFRTQPLDAPTGEINGSVTNNTGKTCTITVTIEEGNTVRTTQVLANVVSGASADFSFTTLTDGHYNVVADNGSYKVTRLVTVVDGEAVAGVSIALGKTQSVVEIVTPDTPAAAVDGLPEQFENENIVENPNEGYTATDKQVVDSGGTVELKLTVKKLGETSIEQDAVKITEAASGQSIAVYLDLSVLKTVTQKTGEATKTTLTSLPKLITVAIPLPSEAAGKRNITVYRVHEGAASALPADDPGNGGEWVEVDGGYIILHINQFSTYAVGYSEPITPTAPEPEIAKTEHGSVSLSPQWIYPGSKVTITPKPDEGYKVDTVTVTDANGKSVTVTEEKDGTYSFIQPYGKVTITATFKAAKLPFTDVAEKDWFYGSVAYVYEKGLMVGTAEDKFSPYWDTSRGMIVTMLWRLEGSPSSSESSAFTDVSSGQYYSEAVAWAAKHKIVEGYDDGKYYPLQPVTREQLAAILWRYAKYKGVDVSVGEDSNILSYPDAEKISEYAIPAMQWACGAEVIKGRDDHSLDPAGSALRAEVAAMFMRFCKTNVK